MAPEHDDSLTLTPEHDDIFTLTTEQDDVLTSTAERDYILTLTAEHDGLRIRLFTTQTMLSLQSIAETNGKTIWTI